LPGVIAPVPPEKTAVRLELAPAAMDAGLAVKLVMEASGVPPLFDPPQPANVAIHNPSNTAPAAATTRCFITSPSKSKYALSPTYHTRPQDQSQVICNREV
jgi:hypothetical protein